MQLGFILPNKTKNFVGVYIIMLIYSYLFVNKKFKFKADNKNVNFPTQFCIGSISNGFSATESRELSLNEMCMIFLSITIVLINLDIKHSSQIFNDKE